MWIVKWKLIVSLADPKPGLHFTQGSQLLRDLEEALQEVNARWQGQREFEILQVSHKDITLEFRSENAIKNKRSIQWYLQRVSILLNTDKQWAARVTARPGRIFTIKECYEA